jgi:hypothetical protein
MLHPRRLPPLWRVYCSSSATKDGISQSPISPSPAPGPEMSFKSSFKTAFCLSLRISRWFQTSRVTYWSTAVKRVTGNKQELGLYGPPLRAACPRLQWWLCYLLRRGKPRVGNYRLLTVRYKNGQRRGRDKTEASLHFGLGKGENSDDRKACPLCQPTCTMR